MEKAVEVKNVSMRFKLNREKVDNIKEYVIRKLTHKKDVTDEFWALKNINFTIDKGDSFALMGVNGCGKSTLLKIICSILHPTTGMVKVNGRIAPLIELGAGFDMELTGRENVFLNGAVLGFKKSMMIEKYDEIMDFSELKDFEDVPVKNYSSGMLARLGFSIATIVKPDILIVDEILAVGDYAFQKKCHNRMKELMSGGTTVILVSHSATDVASICKHGAWIQDGQIRYIGKSMDVIERYQGKI